MSEGHRNADTGFDFRMTRAQHAELKAEAAELGISLQAFLELKVFGEIAARLRNRRDAQLVDQESLALDLGTARGAADAA